MKTQLTPEEKKILHDDLAVFRAIILTFGIIGIGLLILYFTLC